VSITFLRYLDVCLVLATAPFVIGGGLPVLGYVIGALAWLLTRLGAAAMYAHALRSRDVRVRAGMQVGTMMTRVWIIVAAVILARFAGGRADGIMAAAVVLAAFTVYFVLTLVTRGGQLQAGAGALPGSALSGSTLQGSALPSGPSAPQGRPSALQGSAQGRPNPS
jgi:hypothetical protein